MFSEQKDHEQGGERKTYTIYIKVGQKKRRREEDKRPSKFGRMIQGISGLSLEIIEMMICCHHAFSSASEPAVSWENVL